MRARTLLVQKIENPDVWECQCCIPAGSLLRGATTPFFFARETGKAHASKPPPSRYLGHQPAEQEACFERSLGEGVPLTHIPDLFEHGEPLVLPKLAEDL